MLKSNNSKFRSKCPISCSLDIFGDKWSLLIIRDMVIEQKKTFKDFFSSNEKIASNILTSRLKSLEKIGIISKNSALNNKKTNIYKLTDSGLSLIPTLVEMTIWSENNINFYKKRSESFSSSIKNKQKYIEKIQSKYLRSFDNIL
ncbi:helix-turn-helix transcriptional regulator [Candidatus Marinimicrobia bacterium]|nr:helix-turn-helix transcriptional regulator [Candidatus Neomarinimicrobiota bacterium]MDC0630748.1 helix-turn-helix transcriptional regulator [Candidatus Neomarinimicrobiota bacterium]